MGISKLLQSKEYYVAAMEELDIEAELKPRRAGDQAEEPEVAAMRAALREIDKLKVKGRYEQVRARYWKQLKLDVYHREINLSLSPEAKLFFERWGNLQAGRNSPDPAQKERFNKFFEGAEIRERTIQEVNDLIAVLEPAKKKRGKKRVQPPWRNEVAALDAMRLLCGGDPEPDILEAARHVAREEKLAQEKSRADYFDRLYRERQSFR